MDSKNANTGGKRNFFTDASKIVHRHLENEDDEITEEDLRSVRISTELPPPDEITTGAEADSLFKEEETEAPADRPATTWDVVE